jgi:site-specific recombinase XerD
MKYEIEQKNRAKGIFTWYLRWYDPKTKAMRYKSLKTDNRNEAHRLLLQKNGEMMGRDWAKAPTFRKSFMDFLDDTEMTKGDGLTIRNYRSQLSPLVNFADECGLQSITELSFDLANEFICRYKGLKPNTIAQKLKVCRLFFKWAFKTWDLKAENPFSRIKYPKIRKTEKSFWTPEQVEKILDAEKDKEFRFCFAIMAYAGFRFFEAQKAVWGDFEGDFIKVMGKGSKFAKVPVSAKLRAEIDRYLDGQQRPDSGAVFSDRVTNTATNREVKKACAMAGIKYEGRANCHRFRHSFASNLLRGGASVVTTQRLLRHSTPMITLSVYSHVLKEDLTDAVNLA